jgi:hypothetical protein
MSSVYFYVVDRDFGFAPNPFHGLCTLATCKPITRRVAKPGDWVLGMGGSRLKATGRCVFAMKVSKKIRFNEYWSSPEYRHKRPVRNGSRKMIVGDNIYWEQDGHWNQADSHHSNPDGTRNEHNVKNDTQTDAVLISDHFYYFGSAAILIPSKLLSAIGYANGRSHRVFPFTTARRVITFIEKNARLNEVAADPYDFEVADARYNVHKNKVIKKSSAPRSKAGN